MKGGFGWLLLAATFAGVALWSLPRPWIAATHRALGFPFLMGLAVATASIVAAVFLYPG